ncbi:MAG TPA: SGNH/GDSL hydrolase family protein [Roseimicrobium sp.]|nr:SGNH/GDSL hydrolase family protein [Roseimicrobium sp.]
MRPPVWSLSRNSSGMSVRFVTDATRISARWALRSTNLAMPHMAATGVSGLDLYAKTEDGNWHWLAVGQPKVYPTNSAVLAGGIKPGKREYMIYLPLYNGVSSVEIGLPKDTVLETAGAWGAGERKPILFYGTSILQGACASRPGMVHSSILGRRLQYPTINLGFSGNGKMEPEMADLLSELDPSVYVLDCMPNMSAAEVTERAEAFVHKVRSMHPNTPIILVEDRTYGDAFLLKSRRDRNDTTRAAMKDVYAKLKKQGVKGLSYVEGEKMLANDSDATVDGSHPNDVGFVHQADVLEPVIRKALGR